jgi:hypothetical protein
MFPANPLLYDTVSRMQRAMHHATRGNNFAAAKGIQKQYADMGGQYVESKNDVDPRFRDTIKEEEDAKKRKEKQKKKPGKSGIYLV